MYFLHKYLFGASLLGALAVSANASNWDVSGDIEIQTRWFADSSVHQGQNDSNVTSSIHASTEFKWRGDGGSQRGSIIPFFRVDAIDNERSIFDIREGYWAYEGNNVEWLLGVNTLFWGVTESVHLVDIVNQTDAIADIDGEEKLGQPMVNLAWQTDWGLLSFFILPGFRERTFAGEEGRLRTPLVVDTGDPVYESGAEEKHTDLAFRYSHYFGDFDLGLSIFSGTSREPRLVFNDERMNFTPHYDQTTQVGIDLQYTNDAWLWKLETAYRESRFDHFFAAVGGFEYTSFQIFSSRADLGYLIEYQYDGRNDREPISIADNDIFMALRLAINDPQDTAILAGIVYDHRSDESFINIEADRRVGKNFVITGRARIFNNADQNDPTFSLRHDDYIQISIARYF